MRRLGVCGLVAVVAMGAGRAQESPQEPVATLKIGTRVVAVAAVVADASGAPVRGLGKGDFVLKQDGKEQEIRYFSEDTDLPLTLALLVDTSGSQQAFIEDETRASEVFFKAMLRRPEDRAVLVQFDTILQQPVGMTSSVKALDNALSYLSLPHGGSLAAGRNGTLLYDAIVASSNAVLGKERGRRAIVILTDGVDNGSKATLEGAIAAAQRADVVVYSVLYSMAEGTAYPRMAGPAWGLKAQGQGSVALKAISGATGGRMFDVSRATPLETVYEMIEEEMRLQYQIGYTPPESKPGAYHKIELKVQGGKKMTVQARKGFYSPQ